MHDEIFGLSNEVRYVAIYRDGQLSTRSRSAQGASGEESDKYEELLVNPTLLKLASQRGNIDCGGLSYFIVRYGNFFQFVLPVPGGHISVCFEPTSNPVELGSRVVRVVQDRMGLSI